VCLRFVLCCPDMRDVLCCCCVLRMYVHGLRRQLRPDMHVENTYLMAGDPRFAPSSATAAAAAQPATPRPVLSHSDAAAAAMAASQAHESVMRLFREAKAISGTPPRSDVDHGATPSTGPAGPVITIGGVTIPASAPIQHLPPTQPSLHRSVSSDSHRSDKSLSERTRHGWTESSSLQHTANSTSSAGGAMSVKSDRGGGMGASGEVRTSPIVDTSSSVVGSPSGSGLRFDDMPLPASDATSTPFAERVASHPSPSHHRGPRHVRGASGGSSGRGSTSTGFGGGLLDDSVRGGSGARILVT